MLIFRPAGPEDGDAVLGMVMKPFDLTQDPALDVDRVGHRYGPQIALNDVSLSVMPASFTMLLGLNGAGKSTVSNECIYGAKERNRSIG
jgi:ABC-type sugar transport system ATPase subunit